MNPRRASSGSDGELVVSAITAAGMRRINWLVVGIGEVAVERVLPALRDEPRSEIYGVVSRDLAKGRVHAPRVWVELREALRDPAIDAVYLATPVFLHHPQALLAMRHGKHVLCEKPVALSLAEACGMEQVARQEQRLLGVTYFRRYFPKLLRARELLAAGAIGTPVRAFASCSEWVPQLEGERSWLQVPRLAGSGPLYDIGSHRIDALNFLFGEPDRVIAQMNTAVRPFAVEDAATVLIEYRCGARALVDARWNTHVAEDEFRILGTDGELDLSPLNSPPLTCCGRSESWPRADNPHLPCLVGFVDALLEGKPLACAADQVRGTARVLDEAIKPWRAAQRGRGVAV